MLILTRKRSEKIQIGDDIVIKVIRTGKSTVKIGIEAPHHVRVLRGELCEPETVNDATPRHEIADENLSAFVCSDQFPHPHIA